MSPSGRASASAAQEPLENSIRRPVAQGEKSKLPVTSQGAHCVPAAIPSRRVARVHSSSDSLPCLALYLTSLLELATRIVTSGFSVAMGLRSASAKSEARRNHSTE